ncbi:MAG: hypothetical protein V4490_00625, partial [Pseudomonadota bacterium]
VAEVADSSAFDEDDTQYVDEAYEVEDYAAALDDEQDFVLEEIEGDDLEEAVCADNDLDEQQEARVEDVQVQAALGLSEVVVINEPQSDTEELVAETDHVFGDGQQSHTASEVISTLGASIPLFTAADLFGARGAIADEIEAEAESEASADAVAPDSVLFEAEVETEAKTESEAENEANPSFSDEVEENAASVAAAAPAECEEVKESSDTAIAAATAATVSASLFTPTPVLENALRAERLHL